MILQKNVLYLQTNYRYNTFFMNRYIRIEENTIVKKQIVTYYIDSCNNCPLMFYNRSGFSCKCRVFRNKEHNNIIKGFVMGFYNNKLGEKINIPNWCGLPKDLTELKKTDKYYIVNNGVVISSYKPNIPITPIINNTFSLIDINSEDEDDVELFDSILNSFEPMGESDRIINNEITYIEVSGIKCSLCGEFKDEVRRRKNDGMCNECYTKSENNNILLRKAFINNFRLKRNITITDKEYKII